MRRFLTWVHETDASKVNALLGALGFALLLLIVGLMAIVAFWVHASACRVIDASPWWVCRPPLAVPEVWVSILDSILIATAVWAGVAQAAQIGRRAATKPEVVRAEAQAEATKELAKATAIERIATAEHAVVAREGRTLPVDDPQRGLSDDGEPL